MVYAQTTLSTVPQRLANFLTTLCGFWSEKKDYLGSMMKLSMINCKTRSQSYKDFYHKFITMLILKHSDWLKFLSIQSDCLNISAA